MTRGTTAKRQRSAQDRATETRRRIANGAIEVLAHSGVPGLTHRAVVRACGASLAATTYHFDTKADMLAEASRMLLSGYLEAFRRLEARMAAGEEKGLRGLDDLVGRVVGNAIGRERTRSIAWCRIILHGGRSESGRTLAQDWYRQLSAIWQSIAERMEPNPKRQDANAAIDLAVGLTFLLHPLGIDAATAHDLIAGRIGLAQLDAGKGGDRIAASLPPTNLARHAQARERIVQAAIDILVEDGPEGVSYRAVAERIGMVRSGPSYYFPSIDGLLETAQTALFDRAKARYRAGIGATVPSDFDENRLVDLTTAIFFREAMEFASENLGYYSVWLSATQNPTLRAAVLSSLLDQDRAWERRLSALPGAGAPSPGAALRPQACFVGKLIRAIVGGSDLDEMANARGDFAAALRAAREDP